MHIDHIDMDMIYSDCKKNIILFIKGFYPKYSILNHSDSTFIPCMTSSARTHWHACSVGLRLVVGVVVA